MNRLANKVRRFESCFQFHLLRASLAIEITGDGCDEKVRFEENKYLKYEIDTSCGDLGAFDCEVIVHDCGADITEGEAPTSAFRGPAAVESARSGSSFLSTPMISESSGISPIS